MNVAIKNPEGNDYALLHPGELLTKYSEKFSDLGSDVEHPKEIGGRTRKFSQFHCTYSPDSGESNIRRLVNEPFLQGPTNKLTGHVTRHFDEIDSDVDLVDFIEDGFKQLSQRWDLSCFDGEWLVNYHQIRQHAFQQTDAIPAPEGIHKDGIEFVIVGCVAKEGVEGGVMTLHRTDDEVSDPVFGTTLTPGQSIAIHDREVFHHVTPVKAQADYGYRDIILCGFHQWSAGHYKGDLEKSLFNTGKQ